MVAAPAAVDLEELASREGGIATDQARNHPTDVGRLGQPQQLSARPSTPEWARLAGGFKECSRLRTTASLPPGSDR